MKNYRVPALLNLTFSSSLEKIKSFLCIKPSLLALLGTILFITTINAQIIQIPGTSESFDLHEDEPILLENFIEIITDHLNTNPAFILARGVTVDSSGRSYVHYFDAKALHHWLLSKYAGYGIGQAGLYPTPDQIRSSRTYLNTNPLNKLPFQSINYYSLTDPNTPLRIIPGTWNELIKLTPDRVFLNPESGYLRALLDANYSDDPLDKSKLQLAIGKIILDREGYESPEAYRYLQFAAQSPSTGIQTEAVGLLNRISQAKARAESRAASAAASSSAAAAAATPGSITALVAQGRINPSIVVQRTADGSITLDLRNLAIANLSGIENLVTPTDYTNIKVIMLNQNQLNNIPTELRAFLDKVPNLEKLWLGQNQIQEIPAGFLANNPRVSVLGLADNPLRMLPGDFLANQENVTFVNLKNTQLTREQLQALPDRIKNVMNPEAKELARIQ